MVHNRLFPTQFRFNPTSKKNFRPETLDDETKLATKQILYGTLNGLIYCFSTSQTKIQVQQFPLFL